MQGETSVLVLGALIGCGLLGVPARAAPMMRPADLSLELRLVGAGLFDPDTLVTAPLGVETSASVGVDPVAESLTISAGVFQTAGPVVRLATGVSSVQSLSLAALSNGVGLFTLGGAALPSEAACPPAAREACVDAIGFGGALSLQGLLNVVLLPGLVTLPISLGAAGVGVGGPPGGTGTVSTLDGAPFTVAAAGIAFAGTGATPPPPIVTAGSVTISGFTMVSPVYVRSFGFEFPFLVTLEVRFTDGQGVPGFVSAVIPEPSSVVLLGLGVAGLARSVGLRRKPGG